MRRLAVSYWIVRAALVKVTSRADVEARFNPRVHTRLELVKVNPAMWIIETPYTFGAQNWILYLDFTGDELTAMRVRTVDTDRLLPPGAPVDIVPQVK